MLFDACKPHIETPDSEKPPRSLLSALIGLVMRFLRFLLYGNRLTWTIIRLMLWPFLVVLLVWFAIEEGVLVFWKRLSQDDFSLPMDAETFLAHRAEYFK